MMNKEYAESKEKQYSLTDIKLIEDSKKPIKRVIKYMMEE